MQPFGRPQANHYQHWLVMTNQIDWSIPTNIVILEDLPKRTFATSATIYCVCKQHIEYA